MAPDSECERGMLSIYSTLWRRRLVPSSSVLAAGAHCTSTVRSASVVGWGRSSTARAPIERGSTTAQRQRQPQASSISCLRKTPELLSSKLRRALFCSPLLCLPCYTCGIGFSCTAKFIGHSIDPRLAPVAIFSPELPRSSTSLAPMSKGFR
jgi:hypothetical protein